MKFSRIDSKTKLIEMLLSIVGTCIAVAGAIVAYNDYRDKARIQTLSELHAEQLSVCQEIAEASAQLYDARTQSDFDKSFDRFASLKHGKALVVVSPSVLGKMLETYNVAINIRFDPSEKDARSKIRKSLCNKPFEIALACRRMIAEGYKSQGGIQELNDNYTMNWSSSFCN